VRELQIAARHDRLLVTGDDAVRVLIVVQVVNHGVEDQADRLAEVEEARDRGQRQQLIGRAHVGEHHHRRVVAGEQRLAVHGDARVVVHVDHAGRWVDRLGDLVRVLRGRQAGAEVEELADAPVGHVPDRAPQRSPVEPRAIAAVRHGPHRFLGHHAVHGEIVLAAQDGVVDSRHAWHGRVDVRRCISWVQPGPRHVTVRHVTVSRAPNESQN
jgi:hypothetical protein